MTVTLTRRSSILVFKGIQESKGIRRWIPCSKECNPTNLTGRLADWVSRIVPGDKLRDIFGFQCGSSVELYDHESCEAFWNCTAEDLLQSTNETVSRQDFGRLQIEEIGHTPLWLRVVSNKLHCVIHPDFQIKRYRLKIYRAAHYINRLNRLLRQGKLRVADGTEWWTHHSDWVKVRAGRVAPPVFSVSGAAGYADIAGIPFMSFSDKTSYLENIAFRRLGKQHRGTWESRREAAFFRGSLSDCADAVNVRAGDVEFCARAKVVYHSKKAKNPLLSSISTTSSFDEVGLSKSCDVCTSQGKKGESFVHDLLTHKYVLDFAGAGNWSRRMSLLLRSGGLIFKSESPGYQFYEFHLKPGVHYIPFNPEIGRRGAGNLLSRLEWAQNNDEIIEDATYRKTLKNANLGNRERLSGHKDSSPMRRNYRVKDAQLQTLVR
ncbi:unnamed protein product [Bathycoccus prasinos]